MEPNFSATMSDRERLQLMNRNAQPKQVVEPIQIEQRPLETKSNNNTTEPTATENPAVSQRAIDSETRAMAIEERRSLALRKEHFDDTQHRRRRDEYEQEEQANSDGNERASQEASPVEGMEEEGVADGATNDERSEKENNESDLEEFKDLALTKKSTAKSSNNGGNERDDGNKKRARAGQDNFKNNNNGGGAKANEKVAVVNLIDPTNSIPQRHWICSKCKSCREYIRDNANRGTCQACGCGLIFHLKGEEEYEQGTLEDLSDDGEFGEYDSEEERERRNYNDDNDDSY